MKTLKEYIINLLSIGKYFFSKKAAIFDLKLNPNQFRLQAYRLSKKKLVKKIRNDFYMIITAEYFNIGSLPAHWIINEYMNHINQDYYIGLLSAASIYGVTDQQPMIFQVITTKTTKPINLGRILIHFYVYKHCLNIRKTTIKTPTAYAKISIVEQTILDLIRFYKDCGYLNNVSLVIKELSKQCDPKILQQVATTEFNEPVLQRLGYILELIKNKKLASIIEQELWKRKYEYVDLRPDLENKKGEKSARWKLTLNDSLEFE